VIKIFNKQITAIELFFIMIIPLGALFISNVLYIQLQAITIFLACFVIVIKERTVKIKNNVFLFTSLFLFGLGSAVGLYYVIFESNDTYKYIQYCFLTFSAYIGFKYGYVKSQNNITDFILFICLSETILFIPLLFKNEFYRSSIGTSNLFPVILLLMLYPQFWNSSLSKIIGIIVFVLQILCILLSGMRSSVGLGLFTSVLLVIYLLRSKKKRIYLINRILLLLFSAICLYFILPSSFLNSIDSKLHLVEQRLTLTLFNDEGIKIDTDDEKGRKKQGESVLKAIERKNSNNILILGYGHGFTFFDEMDNEQKAHSHITWTIFYARYGIIGLTLYIVMFCFVFVKLFFLFFSNISNENIFSFGLWLSVLQIFLLSLIAGSLVSIINWIIIGIAVSFDDMRRNKNGTL